MDKIWNLMGERIKNLSIVESILYLRGIRDKEEIEEFLSNKPKKTYDAFIMKNMESAVERIKYHLKNNSKIVIYGDYDVDGITGTALLLEFFMNITDNIDYYIPNRFSEGYGLNCEAIKYIKEEMGGELIITVDNGISSYAEVEYGKRLGIDFIITDHHNPPEGIPDAIVINPKQRDDNYPFKDLCGCGIAFKLAQGLQRELKLPKEYVTNALDLVALGTIADIVPLLDENRTMVKYGLKMINKNKRKGLAILREVVGLSDKEINSGRVGFILAPCFNAAGRMEDARLGVELLLEKDEKRGFELAKTLYKMNRERQRIQEEGEVYCKELVEREYAGYDFLVLRADHISEGVIGIIAGKIKDWYYKPTLVVTKGEDGYLKGSGRSIKGINIYEILKENSDLFLGFGGHEMACGFSIEEDKLDTLRERLNKRMKEIKERDPLVFVPKLDIAVEIDADELSLDLINEIKKLEPYGMGNPKPLFIIKNVQVNSTFTAECGSDNSHLKFSGKKDNIFLKGIGFSMAEKYRAMGWPDKVDVVFVPEANEYKGRIEPQMIIEDIREAIV